MKIGVMLDCFRTSPEESMKKAAQLGIEGVQLTVGVGELTQERVRDYPVRETLAQLAGYGLTLTALCGLSGWCYNSPEENRTAVEKTCLALELSERFGCGIVTSHIGVVPAEECPEKAAMRDALNRISAYGDRIGASFAIETGPEPGRILGGLLDSLDGGGVRINLDPANLVMCSDDRPEEALKHLGRYVVHTHAKDGIMVEKHIGDPDLSPELKAELERYLARGWTFMERPLGEGDVDFDTYLPALAASGYDGWLTIERETGDAPEADIARAVSFLREKLRETGV